MATSGNSVLTTTRDEICTDVLRLLGVTPLGETPSSVDLATVIRVGNRVVKRLQSMDIPLWKTFDIVVFPAVNQTVYTFGNSGNVKAVINNQFNRTSLASNANSSATSIVVNSATGFAVGYNIAVELDDNSLQWTTITSVSGTTIGLNAALTGNASSSNNVFVLEEFYTRRPLKVKDGYRRDYSSVSDAPLMLYERETYDSLANKSSQGVVNSFYYDPGRNQGTLFIYQAPLYAAQPLFLTIVDPFDLLGNVTDEPDFTDFWLEGLIANIAEALIPYYGIKGDKATYIISKAAEFRKEAEDYDREDGSIFFTLDGNS